MNKISHFIPALILLGACSKAPEISQRNAQPQPDPVAPPKAFEILSVEDTTDFVVLPMRGDVRDKKRFWSGDHWPLKKGSINRRWNAPVRIGFNHRSPTREELLAMPQEKIAQLSPSEKYDLLMGQYDYPLRKEVSQISANENAEMWEGLMNGWALSSYLHFEPTAKTLLNPDGVEIPFGSEDIKGLLAYYYSYHHTPVSTGIVGKPCEIRGCVDDVTAATFHLALANRIGVAKKPLMMDLERTRDIWNHPVVAYETEYRGNAEVTSNVTPGTHSVVRLKTTVTYINEALNMTWGPVHGTMDQVETKQVYQYWLHLDKDARIIGGEWKSNERPDFLWTTSEDRNFQGILVNLGILLDDPAPVVIEPEVTEPEVVEPEVPETETEIEEEIVE